MSKFQKYLEKVINEYDLSPNQVEIVGTKAGGVNVQGSLGGVNVDDLVARFVGALPPEKKNGPNVKAMFIAWLQKNHPDVWAAIQKQGGFDKLLGDKFPPADIVVTGTDAKKGITITPDA